MAYTLANLETLVRQRADLENSTFATTAEIENYLNDSIDELRDILITAYGHEYFLAEYTHGTVSGTGDYDIPGYGSLTAEQKLKKLVRCEYWFDESNGSTLRFAMRPWDMGDAVHDYETRSWRTYRPRYRLINNSVRVLPIPDDVYYMGLLYIPQLTRYSTGDTVDVWGWEEYVVVDAAIKCLTKEESDTSALQAAKAALYQRIVDTGAHRDAGNPSVITDVYGDAWSEDIW